MTQEIKNIMKKYCAIFGYEEAAMLAFLDVETGGLGFDSQTGKIIIQFEPSWFRKREPYAPSGLWSVNGVERQAKEWLAFDSAYKIDPKSAMESTSIGLGQVMGGNYERLGYPTVDAMWTDAKTGLDRQVWQCFQFIKTDKILEYALKRHNFDLEASRYNGANYKALAKKYGRTPYNISLSMAYKKYKE